MSVDRLINIYNQRKHCLLNELYYGYRVATTSRIGTFLDVLLALGTAASTISGWIIWDNFPAFKHLWIAIAVFTTALATIKPALRLDEKISRYSDLFATYRGMTVSMSHVVDDIADARGISAASEREFRRVRAVCVELAAKDDPQPSSKLVKKFEDEVNRRFDINRCFFPGSKACP